MTDPVEIARGLSEAQKRALLWLPEDGGWRRRGKGMRYSFPLLPLVDTKIDDDDAWGLTPLGLAVRTALVARLAAEEGDARDGE